MSSNQSNSQRRVTSIKRQLVGRLISRKIWLKLGFDISTILIILITWFATLEYAACGKVNIRDNKHQFTNEIAQESEENNDFFRLTRNVRYTVTNKQTGEVIVDVFYFEFVKILCIVSMILFLVQVSIAWMEYPSENKVVSRVLKPLDDLAIKADELAKYDFSEDKYHIIEEKITSIEPDDQQTISLGDESLMGIENAMNNLLQRIRESNKQQARFVNDASHELRTPIAVIQGYANMLARWGREDEKVLDESITAIQNESENMKHLVEQLLFLARGDAGRTAINMTQIDICEVMQEVYEESLMIDEKHIYRFSKPDSPLYVMADEGLIKQAVRILVDNSAKYTKEKDEILLKVGVSENNTVFLQVQDSGIGMKEADVSHMFERFYRADEARSFNGTGLGLSIAKWIVDKHNGHFEIISREELGTRIGIYLPKM